MARRTTLDLTTEILHAHAEAFAAHVRGDVVPGRLGREDFDEAVRLTELALKCERHQADVALAAAGLRARGMTPDEIEAILRIARGEAADDVGLLRDRN